MKGKVKARRKWAETAKTKLCRILADGRFERGEVSVIIEKEMRIYVNGQHLVTASITPSLEREFVIGYLFGQGFIKSPEDIKSVEIEDNGAQVTLKDSDKPLKKIARTSYRIVSGGGQTAFAENIVLPEIRSRRKIKQENIFIAMNTLFETARMYRETEGVHAAGLFTRDGGLMCIVEDIGRHNTIDKVIGYALLNKVDCGNTFLVSTGRMASEMVTKICRAGIPVVATKTAVTNKGLETGRKHGMTIIGFVRDTGMRLNTDMEVRIINQAGMKIYTHASRVPCEENSQVS